MQKHLRNDIADLVKSELVVNAYDRVIFFCDFVLFCMTSFFFVSVQTEMTHFYIWKAFDFKIHIFLILIMCLYENRSVMMYVT